MIRLLLPIRLAPLLLLALGLVVLAGCVSPPRHEPQANTVSVQATYALPPDRMAEVMREALGHLPVEVIHQADPLQIHTRSTLTGMPGNLRVSLRDDGNGGTVAEISSLYRIREAFTHLPMQLVMETDALLKPCRAYLHPQQSVGQPESWCYEEGPPLCAPEPEEETSPEWVVVEEMPVVVGGLEGLQQRVRYPAEARRMGAEGTVWAQFFVDEAGEVACAVVLSGLPGGLNDAVLSAIMETEFEPGRQDGVPVRVRLHLPVRFRLR